MAFLEKLSLEWLRSNISPELAAVIAVLFIVVWLTVRINKVITQAHFKEEEQNKRLALCEKRSTKIINAICETPCFKESSANCVWIQKDDRNGGSLPEQVACPLLKEREGR